MIASTNGMFPTAREGQGNVLLAMAAISVESSQRAAEPGGQAQAALAAGAVADRSRVNLLKSKIFLIGEGYEDCSCFG
jgi:hypothetical protein